MKKLTILFLLSLNLSGFCITDTTGQKEFKINAFFAPERLTITELKPGQGGEGYGLNTVYFNYTTGIATQFPITKRLHLGTGITYTQQDIQATYACAYCNTDANIPPIKLDLKYIEAPLFLQYNILNKKLKLYVQTGVQGSYLINIPDLYASRDPRLFYNKYNLKWVFGVGSSLNLGKHFSFNLTPTYRYAFNSLYKDSHIRMHSIGIAGGISYRIRM